MPCYYSKGFIEMLKKLELLCIKKDKLPEKWKNAIGNKEVLICTKGDLEDPTDILVNLCADSTAISKNGHMILSGRPKSISHDARDNYVSWTDSRTNVYAVGNEPINEVVAALIRFYGMISWTITEKEFERYKNDYNENGCDARRPGLISWDGTFRELCVKIFTNG